MFIEGKDIVGIIKAQRSWLEHVETMEAARMGKTGRGDNQKNEGSTKETVYGQHHSRPCYDGYKKLGKVWRMMEESGGRLLRRPKLTSNNPSSEIRKEAKFFNVIQVV